MKRSWVHETLDSRHTVSKLTILSKNGILTKYLKSFNDIQAQKKIKRFWTKSEPLTRCKGAPRHDHFLRRKFATNLFRMWSFAIGKKANSSCKTYFGDDFKCFYYVRLPLGQVYSMVASKLVPSTWVAQGRLHTKFKIKMIIVGIIPAHTYNSLQWQFQKFGGMQQKQTLGNPNFSIQVLYRTKYD